MGGEAWIFFGMDTPQVFLLQSVPTAAWARRWRCSDIRSSCVAGWGKLTQSREARLMSMIPAMTGEGEGWRFVYANVCHVAVRMVDRYDNSMYCFHSFVQVMLLKWFSEVSL